VPGVEILQDVAASYLSWSVALCCALPAGRDNFLAAEADRALTILCSHASEARCVVALVNNANHKSPHARARVAAHLDEICSSGNLGTLAMNYWALAEKMFK
jgi:hypothetical protein